MSSSMRALMLAVAAVIAASGCGGGGDGAPATAASPASAAGSLAPSPAPAPSPSLAPAPAPASATCGLANFVQETLQRVNEIRARGASCGDRSFGPAPALTWNDALATATAGHSTDMATNNYFSHTSLSGATMVDRISSAGYAWSSLAENIAAGYGSIAAVMTGWMDSDDHCANVMNPQLREIGMACAANDSTTYGTYWTMDLGAPR